jgi:hypothetical protein
VVLLGDVPGLLGVTPDRPLEGVPYLEVAAQRRERWRAWLGEPTGPRVGVCWQGEGPSPARWHSLVPGSVLAALRQVPGVQWVPLAPAGSTDPLPREIADLGGRVPEWPAEEGESLQEVAALVAELDLVVTVDGAIAHLAGALGVPVWVVLPATPAWYWLLEREDTPWYPQTRLFRVDPAGDWDAVAVRLAAALAALPGPSRPPESRPEGSPDRQALRKRGWWW